MNEILVDRLNIISNRIAETKGSRMFIGHGHSKVWIKLKGYIHDTLKLEYDEFNQESTAGISIIERLSEMLYTAGFAFLIFTAEDEQLTGEIHPRLNVIHDAGLFQGRLGFKKAIILIEEGCKEFSNIYGLGQIRFHKDRFEEIFENVEKVIKREGLLK